MLAQCVGSVHARQSDKIFATALVGGMRPAGVDCRVGRAGRLDPSPARLIAVHHHNRFPVVGDDGKPLGIMTRVDVFDAFAR